MAGAKDGSARRHPMQRGLAEDMPDRTLPAHDLVPLLSFAVLRGRCRFCRAGIARFHLWIELAAIAVAAWAM